MENYTPNLFFFKPPIGARGQEQKRLFDLSLDQADARLGKEIWVGDPQFVWHADPCERLKNAVSGLDTTPAILRIPPETFLFSESYSIPDNITVVLERGAIFHLATGVTLTLDGGLEAGPYQIFTGGGTVVIGKPAEIFSEWWGLPGWSSPEGNITAPVGSRYMKTTGLPPLYYIKNSGDSNTGWQAIGADGGGGTGASYFTDLYDAPPAYTGQSGKVVRVNTLANALEFGNPDHTHANKSTLDAIDQNLASSNSPTFAGLTVNGNLTVSGTVDGVDVANHKTRHESGGPDALAHQNLVGAGAQTHAQIDAHLASTGNPHAVTAAQVGLGNVTNEAQLTRAAGDLNSLPEKTTPASADVLLLEDSAAGYAKKKVRLANLPTGSGGSTTFTDLTDTPDSFTGQGSKVVRVNAAENALEFSEKHFGIPLANNSSTPLVLISGTAGENLNQWDVVYLNADGKYYQANASAGATMPALALATAAVTANATGSFMLLGLFRDDANLWIVGGPLYLDSTDGRLSQTAPSGGTAIVQVVGIALTPTIGWINPHLNFAGWFC